MASHHLRVGLFVLMIICSVRADEYTDYDRDAHLDELKSLLGVQMQQNKGLEEMIHVLFGTVKTLTDKNNVLEKRVKAHELKTDRIESNLKTYCKADDTLNKQPFNTLKSTHGDIPSIHRRQQGSSTIAFFSFLDHNMNSLGPSEAIVFNKVQLNDGNGYSQHTGALSFTVPVSGVYVFTFSIGERNPNQLYVKLVVNGVAKSDAVVETVQGGHDAQGGNVVILKVNRGDVVMIKHNLYGTHIEGHPAIRLSTFSGFLLYELDTEVIVGK